MTVKEYATSMGVSVNKLSEITGLSRQGLHNIIVKGYKAAESKSRLYAINKLLRHINDDCNKKQDEAETEHKNRIELLELFYK